MRRKRTTKVAKPRQQKAVATRRAVTRRRSAAVTEEKQGFSYIPGDMTRGWWPVIREPYAGAWQRNEDTSLENVTTHAVVFSCVTLIAGDISKMRPRIVQLTANGIWQETFVPAFSPVLRKPNHFQSRLQFLESWVLSKLLWGNAYIYKVWDRRDVVSAMYVLDPSRVSPLLSETGQVYYGLRKDSLSTIAADQLIVGAEDIIHDRHNTLFHPLVGLSAIYAAGVGAAQGLNIQHNSSKLFSNGMMPGGVLTAPGTIRGETAERLKSYVTENFSGDSIGKLMVLGDGLKYEPIGMRAIDAQLIEQLRWTGENACTAFHVPPYMVGVGAPPNYNNIEALNQQYYSQCLQVLIENIELCLDEGLGLTEGEVAAERYGVEFDIDDLLRMDTKTLVDTEKNSAGIKSPNESRRRLNLPPVAGGDQPYLQEQNWPLVDLAKRDINAASAPKPAPEGRAPLDGEVVEDDEPETEDESTESRGLFAAALARRALRGVRLSRGFLAEGRTTES